MLTAIPAEEDDEVLARKRRLGLDGEAIGGKVEEDTKVYGDIDWKEMVSGTKKVLAMDVRTQPRPSQVSPPLTRIKLMQQSETHLRFLLSQLRNEHLYCLWCATKYSSFEEMDGPGGCPGEDEDDH